MFTDCCCQCKHCGRMHADNDCKHRNFMDVPSSSFVQKVPYELSLACLMPELQTN